MWSRVWKPKNNNHDPPKPVPGHPDKIIKDYLKLSGPPPTYRHWILPSISDGTLHCENDRQDDRWRSIWPHHCSPYPSWVPTLRMEILESLYKQRIPPDWGRKVDYLWLDRNSQTSAATDPVESSTSSTTLDTHPKTHQHHPPLQKGLSSGMPNLSRTE